MVERAPDHNPDIATDIHLSEIERKLSGGSPRRRGSRSQFETEIFTAITGAARELQLWNRSMNVEISRAMGAIEGVNGRLRRLEAAAAADDVALDDLRDLIDELRVEMDRVVSRGETAGP